MMCCRVSEWRLPEWRPDADQTLGGGQAKVVGLMRYIA